MGLTKKEKQLKEKIKKLEAENRNIKLQNASLSDEINHYSDRQRIAESKAIALENHKNSLEPIKNDYIEAFKHMRKMEEKNFDAIVGGLNRIGILIEVLGPHFLNQNKEKK